jgi:HAD superfamily hydrolase (TIGR01509 family)
VARPEPEPPAAVAPVVTEQRCVAVDGLGVLFREADDLADRLIPFARQRGSTKSDAEILARARWLRLGRITTAELWSAIGVAGEPGELDAAYLAGHQLSPGVIRYLRGLRERGIRLACIINESAEWTARLRARHSLESLIELWVISGAVGVTKPDRSIFEVLRRVTQEAPGAILLIDDDLDVLDAARQLGFATAWFNADARVADARDHTIIRRFGLTDDDLVDADRT